MKELQQWQRLISHAQCILNLESQMQKYRGVMKTLRNSDVHSNDKSKTLIEYLCAKYIQYDSQDKHGILNNYLAKESGKNRSEIKNNEIDLSRYRRAAHKYLEQIKPKNQELQNSKTEINQIHKN